MNRRKTSRPLPLLLASLHSSSKLWLQSVFPISWVELTGKTDCSPQFLFQICVIPKCITHYQCSFLPSLSVCNLLFRAIISLPPSSSVYSFVWNGIMALIFSHIAVKFKSWKWHFQVFQECKIEKISGAPPRIVVSGGLEAPATPPAALRRCLATSISALRA